MKNKNIFHLIFFFFLFFSTNINCSEKAIESIEKFHNSLKDCNHNIETMSKKVEFLKNSISETFDYKKMIRFIYGRDWKNLNIELQNELTVVFLEYISFNYANRFKNIESLNFEYVDLEEIDDNKKIVKTNLNINNDKPIKIDYLFVHNNENWRVFDVLLTGSISEISTKKSEFFSIIKNEGAPGLIKKIREKIIY
tara:strand:+ start:1653 stop:2240 length:588 start_codon:yes stop_codon:yes gene_type:complete